MYCKECGKKIDNDSKYCRYCGIFQNNYNTNISKDLTLNQNIRFPNSGQKKAEKIEKSKSTYNEAYEKEITATIVGLIIIISNLIILFSGEYSNLAQNKNFYPIFSVINLVWRIIATIWVVNIAKRQNRQNGGWGLFAFFIPNLALIIIGLQKKRKNTILNKPKNDSILKNKGNIEMDSQINSHNLQILNKLIQKQKMAIIGSGIKNKIIELIKNMVKSKSDAVALIEKFQIQFSIDLISELKRLTDSYSGIKDYLAVFIDFEIVDSNYPHNKL